MTYARFIQILTDECCKNISYFIRFGGKLAFNNHHGFKNAFTVTKNKYLIDQEDRYKANRNKYMAYPITRHGLKSLSERQANVTRYSQIGDLPDKQRTQYITHIKIYTVN